MHGYITVLQYCISHCLRQLPSVQCDLDGGSSLLLCNGPTLGRVRAGCNPKIQGPCLVQGDLYALTKQTGLARGSLEAALGTMWASARKDI